MTKPPKQLSLHERIRNRRTAMGLAGYELARLARISPSYLSLIEKGAKIPSEEIALALARALDDNPDLYLAWTQAGRLGNDVPSHLARLRMLHRLSSLPDSRRRLRSGEDLQEEDQAPLPAVEQASRRARRWLAREEPDYAQVEDSRLAAPPDLLEIPLLAEGADPGDDPAAAPGLIETLRIDRSLLPPDVERPFAYRPGPRAIAGLEDALDAGDVVFLTSRVDLPLESSIYAVRTDRGVALARVIHHENVLLVLPPDRRDQPSAHDVGVHGQLQGLLAGRVVASLRAWRDASTPRPAARSPEAWRPRPRGRSVRVRGDFLVRDCEWRHGYGWRPIQRAEDLDWLEQHPGTKVRFRLIRDGEVRYRLEMTPEEWREALGEYADSDAWRTSGYVGAVTRRRSGEYTEEFQDRWAPFIREGPGT